MSQLAPAPRLSGLSPTERAVSLLHEVFGYDYREIAEITGKTEPTVSRVWCPTTPKTAWSTSWSSTSPTAWSR